MKFRKIIFVLFFYEQYLGFSLDTDCFNNLSKALISQVQPYQIILFTYYLQNRILSTKKTKFYYTF